MLPALLSRWLPSRKTKKIRRNRPLGIELLEDRIVPSSDIVVGRTLSAYTVGSVLNNSLDVTYTVYNQTADDVTGVLLTTTLQPGVTFVSAMSLPDRNGQELAWSLGNIPGYGRTSVTLTVTLPAVPPLQIDSGAEAFATRNAGMVTDDTPAAALVNRAIPADQLAATPDANSADPFIQEKAAELDYDPQRIFNFLRTEVGYESYVGSLRGARGTLWSHAGNALDEASLGVALFRASGIPARYAQGTLSDPLARDLILSMFPPSFQTVGYIPPGTEVADPANDPQLLSETRHHSWIQFDTGTGFQDIDTTFANAAIGQTFAPSAGTFTEVADAQRHKVTVRLNVETYGQTSQFINITNGLGTRTVIDETFNSVELVGRPLSIGHFVNSTTIPSPTLISRTTIYSPYIAIGDAAFGSAEDVVLRGDDFQEVLTNLALGNQVLSGVFLEMQLNKPSGSTEVFERALVDRIGFAARAGRTSASVTVDPDGPPVFTELDVVTLHAWSGRNASTSPGMFASELDRTATRLEQLVPTEGAVSGADIELLREAVHLQTRVVGAALHTLTDAQTARIADGNLVKSYSDHPRLVLVSNRLNVDFEMETASLFLEIDLRQDSVRAVAFPGQLESATRAFQGLRGVAESRAEDEILRTLLPVAQPVRQVSAVEVFRQAHSQGVGLQVITAATLGELGGLSLSLEAQARIVEAVGRGQTVIVPVSHVTVGDASAIAWYEINPATGEAIGVGEDGGHQGVLEYAFLLAFVGVVGFTIWSWLPPPQDPPQSPPPKPPGLAVTENIGRLNELTKGRSPSPFVQGLQTSLSTATPAEVAGLDDLGSQFVTLLDGVLGASVRGTLGSGQLSNPTPPPPIPLNEVVRQRAITATLSSGSPPQVAGSPAALTTDQNTPVEFDIVVSTGVADTYSLVVEAPVGWTATIDSNGRATLTPPPGSQGGTVSIRVKARSVSQPELVAVSQVLVTLTPTQPGLSLAVEQDPVLFVPVNGAQLPSAFRAVFQNLGPATDTFTVSLSNLPAGFNLQSSGGSATVPAGKTGILGVYLVPTGALPAPGTVVTFDVTATSNTNAAITQTQTVNFTVPQIHGITLSTDRSALGTTPGVGANVALTLRSVGNVAESVALTATLPTGLALGGLTGTVPLALGGSQTLNLTLTPDANVPLNSTLAVTITATFATGELGVQTIQIPIRVVAPGAEAAANASGSANQIGNTDLANRLSDLATGITNLFQTTDSAVFKAQVLAALDAVAGLVAADDFLGPLVPAPTAARAALVAAVTQTEIRDALTLVGDYLEVLQPQLLAVARHGFTFELDRTAAVIETNVRTHFQVLMQNLGTQTTTYQLTATSIIGIRYVRNGATITSVTLQPGQVIAGGADGITLEHLLHFTPNALPYVFSATARAVPATQLARTIPGSVTVRPDFLRVASVVTDPPFTDAEPTVSVTARLYNGLHAAQDILASYVVRAPGGAVVFTSPTVAFTLPAQGANLASLALAPFPTAGFADGEYTVDVTITDADGEAIPGGEGSGRVRVGLPVSASLVSAVEILSPGNQSTRASQQSLTLSATLPLADPFTLIGQVGTSGNSSSLTIIGNIAYVAGTEAVDIVDISNAANPVLVGSFAQGFVPPSGYSLVRDLPGDRIAVMSSITLNAPGFGLRVYDVTNPIVPTLVSDTTINQRFLSDFQAIGNTALVSTLGESTLEGSFGDVYAVDLAAAGGPAATDRLFGTLPGTSTSHQSGVELVDADTAYVASFYPSPALANRRVGRLLVVDYSNPANLVLTRQVDLPATFKLYDVAISDNTALVVGTDSNDTGPFTARFNPGHLVLITLDITDRDNPVVVSTETTTATFPTEGMLRIGFPSVVPVGGGKFAVSYVMVDDEPVILLADASDPSNIRASALNVGGAAGSFLDEIAVAGGNLYATSDNGLLVFDIADVESIPVTASVQVPAGFARNFNIAPDRITTAAGVDTLEWDRVLGAGIENQEFTWFQSLPVSPGIFRDITFGGTVSFTSQGTPGTITLPGTGVGALGSFAVDPGLRTVRPGETAEFTVSINDPGPDGGNANYGLRVTGVPAAWANFPTSIRANAQGQATFTLRLTPDADANLADYAFVVDGWNGFNAIGAAGGTLRVAGTPVNAPDPDSRGVVSQLTPATATAGQGTSAVYTMRVSNTGSATDSFDLAVSGLPVGVTAALERSSVVVPPGAGNFREVRLVLTSAPGTTAGSIPFTLTATSSTRASVTASTAGTLTVVAAGVDVGLNAASVIPGNAILATITNTGSTTDTFDLAVAGPAGLVAALGTTVVTLASGQSQVVSVATGAAAFALPGGMNLTVTAASRADAAVRDAVSADLAVPVATGLATRFDTPVMSLPLPGPGEFLLLVENSGNTEDAYVATIAGTTGDLDASLIGLDGLPAQSVPIFRLPGLSQGAILVRANAATGGTGTVTVQVQSLNNPGLASSSTATLNVTDPVLVGFREFGVGAGAGFAANARFFNPDASQRYARNAFPGLSGGVRVTSADFNGDGIAELVAGTGPGSITRVIVFDGITGNPIFSTQPFEDQFVGGVFVAAGDITGDGIPDLVISPDESGGPRVSVFSGAGFGIVADFYGIADPDFRGGARVAVGDVNGDGTGDLVVSAGFGGGPRIAVFNGLELSLGRQTRLMPDYFHFEEGLRNGSYVAVGDIDGDGYADVIGGGGPGGGPRVFALSGKDLLTLAPTQAEVVANFFGGDVNNRGGIRVVARDLDGDIRADLVVGDGTGAGSRVTGYLGMNLVPNDTPPEAFAFDAYPGFTGGVFVG